MFKVKFDETAAKTEGGMGGGNLPSGVYDAVIDTASITKAGTGTTGIDWNLNIDGNRLMVYGMWLQKSNGDKLFSYNILQGLMGLLGIDELTTYEKTIDVKNGQKVVDAIKELDGKRVKVALQRVLDWWDGKESIKYEIKAFMDPETGQTYTEKVAGRPAKQIEYYKKLKDKETPEYKAAKMDSDDEDVSEEDGGSLL